VKAVFTTPKDLLMLNLPLVKNVAANASPQTANQMEVGNIVQVLTDSFAVADTGLSQGQVSDFSASLADASAVRPALERRKAVQNDADDVAGRAELSVRKSERRNESKSVASSQGRDVSEVRSANADRRNGGAEKSEAASANDNAVESSGKPSVKKALKDIKEVIDQIDQALASGGEQLSAEMAAMLANMKAVLQQIAQQLMQAVSVGELQGVVDSIGLDAKALAPLLDQLNKIVDSLKKANGELAAALGLDTLADADLPLDTQAFNGVDSDVVEGTLGDNKMLGNFAELATKLEQVVGRVEKVLASPIAQASINSADASLLSAQDANALPTPTESFVAADNVANISEKSGDVGFAAAAPKLQEAVAQPLQNNQAQVSATQVVAANTSGQSGGSNQGQGQNQGQSGVTQISAPSAAANSDASTKTLASFEQALKQPVKASASEQVVFQMKSMVKDGNSKMIVKLDPPELGELEIKMQVNRQGKTDVVIVVERAQTLELLQKDSRMLQQALNDAGLKTDSGSLSFNLKGENSGGQQRQGNNPYPIDKEVLDEEMLQVVSATYTTEVDHGVNIRI
jgi:flagellar hook-length control protein FliK